MIKEASPEQIQAYVKAACDRLVEKGKTQEEAELMVTQVLTKRAEELGLIPAESKEAAAPAPAAAPAEQVTPQDVVIGAAYETLLARGMNEKQAEAALENYLNSL